MSVAVPFFLGKGLSMQEVFALQAWFALIVVATEVPSGCVADLLGRKHTLVVGAVCCGLGHSCLLFAKGFWTLEVFETFLGFAHSLMQPVASDGTSTPTLTDMGASFAITTGGVLILFI